MVTPEEIGAVEIFSELDEAQRERLSVAAADISLAAGEYAAHEGDDRALFAVLDGLIEPVKSNDGVERVVGRRLPGEIFGEFPLVFGTVFPVGFRAAVPSRVMRIEARDYHAVAAAFPEVAKEVGRLAAHRASGLGDCRAWRRIRHPRARSCSGHAGMRTAPSCVDFWTAIRSPSAGSLPTHPTPSRFGAALCRPNPIARRFR